MTTEIRIYFEGHKNLRPGFAAFFSEIRTRGTEKRCKVEFIATGGKPERDFDIAMKTHRTAWNVLLRDSEGPYNPGLSPSDSKFWMVEMMEAWFHADKAALKDFYGRGYRSEALTANPNVEEIPKRDLISGLKAATKETKKGDYYRNKTTHGPDLLAKIRPKVVREAAPHCEEMFKALFGKIESL
jgi:hypothetical protein